MKRIKLELTEWQADEIIHALGEDINEQYGWSDSVNKRIMRLIDKVEKAKKEAE